MVIGVIAARMLGGALESMLFGVTATDTTTILFSMAALAALGTIAALAPSWRATRIDPVQILRRG